MRPVREAPDPRLGTLTKTGSDRRMTARCTPVGHGGCLGAPILVRDGRRTGKGWRAAAATGGRDDLRNLRGVPTLPRLTYGPKEPCLQLGWKQCLRDPVDRVGDEGTGVQEEPKELRENCQRTAEHVEYRASGVVCALKEATDALKAGGGSGNTRDPESIAASNRELLTLHELIAHRLVQILLGLHRGRTYSV